MQSYQKCFHTTRIHYTAWITWSHSSVIGRKDQDGCLCIMEYKARLGQKWDPITRLWCHLYDNHQPDTIFWWLYKRWVVKPFQRVVVAAAAVAMSNQESNNVVYDYQWPSFIMQLYIQPYDMLAYAFNQLNENDTMARGGHLNASLSMLQSLVERNGISPIYIYFQADPCMADFWSFPSPSSRFLWVLYFFSTLNSQTDFAKWPIRRIQDDCRHIERSKAIVYDAIQLATMLNSKRSQTVVDNDKQPSCRPVHPLPYRTIYQELIWSKQQHSMHLIPTYSTWDLHGYYVVA